MDEKKKEDTYDKDKKVLAFCHTVSGTGYCNVCADAPTGCGAFRDSAVWASAGGFDSKDDDRRISAGSG